MMEVGFARRVRERPIAFGAVELLDLRGQGQFCAIVGKNSGLDAQRIALVAFLRRHFPRREVIRAEQRTIVVELVTGPAAVGRIVELGIIGLALFGQERFEAGAFPEAIGRAVGDDEFALPVGQYERADRSEEHTSELQSLMRISYAVLCLKKNTNDKD